MSKRADQKRGRRKKKANHENGRRSESGDGHKEVSYCLRQGRERCRQA